MKNLKDLFEHELKDLYSAETQLLEAMPKMKKMQLVRIYRRLSKSI